MNRNPIALVTTLYLALVSESAYGAVVISGNGVVTTTGRTISLAGGLEVSEQVRVTWTYDSVGIDPYQVIGSRSWYDADATNSLIEVVSENGRWMLSSGYIQTINDAPSEPFPRDGLILGSSLPYPVFDPEAHLIPGGIPGQSFRYGFDLGVRGFSGDLLTTSDLPGNSQDFDIDQVEIGVFWFELNASINYNVGYTFSILMDNDSLALVPEPSGAVLVLIGCSLAVLRRRGRVCTRSNEQDGPTAVRGPHPLQPQPALRSLGEEGAPEAP